VIKQSKKTYQYH